MMTHLLQNETLLLRAAEPEDLDLLYQVENDTSIWWVGDATGPYSKFSLRQYLANATGDIYTDKQLRLMVEMKKNSTIVGIVDLFSYSPAHRRAEIGILVFPDFRGQGIGRQSMSIVHEYCKRHLHIHQLYAYTPVTNFNSVRMFKYLGYEEEHLMREWLLHNQTWTDAWLFKKIL